MMQFVKGLTDRVCKGVRGVGGEVRGRSKSLEEFLRLYFRFCPKIVVEETLPLFLNGLLIFYLFIFLAKCFSWLEFGMINRTLELLSSLMKDSMSI